ncbi:hypothetical protein [Streptomyces werraensis]|uniref:hypothetical protein n=1 Tax=Streptomyces werraensis TaxID=68284 RepID=UPI0034226AF0
MAKTGPQRYPGASTTYWYGSKYPGSAMESNVVVWHTTEGTSVPSYDGGASAPNFTAMPDFTAKRLIWYQHFDFDVSSRALVNRSGGVQTNTLNVVQVEIVGTCDPATHARWQKAGRAHLYTPELPDWAIRDLAAFAKWAHEHHNVPLTSGVTFKAYPSSYGNSSVRMSYTAWNNYRGHCGHQHVPENDHGDPGLLPMAAILARAKGTTPAPSKPAPTPPKESDMALTPYDVWAYKGRGTKLDERDAYAYLRGTDASVKTLTTQVAALTATVNKLAQLAGSDVDTDRVVAAVEKAIADALTDQA